MQKHIWQNDNTLYKIYIKISFVNKPLVVLKENWTVRKERAVNRELPPGQTCPDVWVEKDCAIRSANQICVISVETTFETHLSSCKKYVCSTVSQCSDGGGVMRCVGVGRRGEEDTPFSFPFSLPTSFATMGNQAVSDAMPLCLECLQG